jgi:hypothetical protein
VVPESASEVGEASVEAPRIEHPRGSPVAKPVQEHPVGAGHLQGVEVGLRGGHTAAEATLVDPVTDDVARDVPGVLDPVDVADLVPVIGRDRDLDDPLLRSDQAEDDLGVEVEAVAVGREVEVDESVRPVGTVAGVPLGELLTGPARAPPLSSMREPKTASASPLTSGATRSSMHSGAYWPSPWSSTTTSRPCSMAQR